MLLLRLGQLAPTSIIPRLDDTVESFKTIMKDVEVKDDTVKQDLERKGECVDIWTRSWFDRGDAESSFENCCSIIQDVEWWPSARIPRICVEAAEYGEMERFQKLQGIDYWLVYDMLHRIVFDVYIIWKSNHE